jgi:hypothetical protein
LSFYFNELSFKHILCLVLSFFFSLLFYLNFSQGSLWKKLLLLSYSFFTFFIFRSSFSILRFLYLI